MIKENIRFCDEVTESIVNIIKEKNLPDNAVTLFPMLRKESDKLLLGSLIEIQDKRLSDRNKVIRPQYWVIIDNNDYSLVEFNKTEEKDYMDTNLIPLNKEFDDDFTKEMKEVSKYSIDKRIQYKQYLMNDIKDEIINKQDNILKSINNKLIIDDKEISATDYLIANVEDEIEKKVQELVTLVVNEKYSAIIYYYQSLIEEILNEYNKTNKINVKKMKLASTILDTYYGENTGVKYFFNV